MKSFENAGQSSEQKYDRSTIGSNESHSQIKPDVLDNEITTETTTNLAEVDTPRSGLDSRQQETIRTGRYFDLYKNELRELFVALGRENEWSDNPREMLAYMRAKWIGGEHGNAADKDQFSDEQIEAAIPVLNKLGLLQELRPQDGSEYFLSWLIVLTLFHLQTSGPDHSIAQPLLA